MDNTQINKLLQEIKGEQHISPFENDSIIEGYIKEAEYVINDSAGEEIKYEIDLEARSLLKNYVFYARHKRLFEFSQLYGDKFAYLQTKYYKPTDLQ